MKRLILITATIFLCSASLVFSQNKIILAVLNFQNNSCERELNYLEEAIPEMLITDLMVSSKITIVERTKINNILEEHKLVLSGVVDENTVIKIGKLIGANHLLHGSVFKFKDTIRLDARICGTSNGKVILAEKVEQTNIMDFIGLIDELAIKLLAGLTNENITIDYTEDISTFEPKAGKVIAVNCQMDNLYKLRDSSTHSYLLLDLMAGKVVKEHQRVPLNISLVIDKSGSMEAENKLENVKKAALFVVDNLNKSDYFSLVTYDTHVNTPIASNLVSNKESLKLLIKNITSGSSTNLSGGMMEGYAQVTLNFQNGYVNRVLLLTDGLANTGITDPNQLKKIVTEKNRRSYTLSTFGVGSDFNEDLLTTIAEFGGANYYFIESPDKIAEIFSNELQGLLSVVAQNVILEVELMPGVTIIDLFGYSYTVENNKIKVKLNDIFSEEKKSILIKLQLPATESTELKIGKVILKYDDVTLLNQRITEKFVPSIKLTNDKKLVQQNKNAVVHENIALFESVKLLDNAMTLIDQRDYEKAQEVIQSNLRFLQSNVNYKSSKRLKQQVLNVAKCSTDYKEADQLNEQELKRMKKSAKYKNYLQMKKK